ncbi:hypothetical protein VTK26DRAFT_9289 [Humicola hyalothermophila]
MRACTAVITEIAFNDSDNEHEKYRAEVHFISADEWVKELTGMLDDLRDAPASPGADNQSSEGNGGISYDKIRAVYPSLTSQEVKNGTFSVESLMEEPSVKDILGTVRRIASSTPEDFLERLKKFIDSKEKTRGRKKEPAAMEFWPLIKVVKVFVRSPILESGLVLVDLPGIHDSNAAVASRYVEQCSGLWVVAPITRAVDDKAAQTLLDDAFKRDLQFDGTYSRVTVICSKSDDISVTEVVKTMSEGEIAHQYQDSVGCLETERRKN